MSGFLIAQIVVFFVLDFRAKPAILVSLTCTFSS
jgi:hypothetical protein